MLTLAEVLESYSHIRLADESDNDAILNFYKDIHMQTGAEALSFDRGNDFFKFYKRRGGHFWTFLFLNDDNSICGVGTILRQLRYISNELIPVAYFCDLRVAPTGGRRAKVQWRKALKDILSALPKIADNLKCEMAYTAILSDNEKAIRSLTRNGRGYKYRFIDNYYVYSVVLPPIFNPSTSRVAEISFEEFKNFYFKENRNYQLVESVSDDHLNHYYGVYDRGELTSVFMYTENDLGRKYKLYNMHPYKVALSKILEWIGRPKVSSGVLETLELQHLTFKEGMSCEDMKESLLSILKYLKNTNILQRFHICNIYTGQNRLDFSLFIDGIIVESAGHMFEIHGDEYGPLWPKDNFRFEGSTL